MLELVFVQRSLIALVGLGPDRQHRTGKAVLKQKCHNFMGLQNSKGAAEGSLLASLMRGY
ncbi:MAG: hypothetical protein PW845_19800 [Pseudomonas sp.]|uniref:hypothetical protein n=1 Tax=Pseudomonas abieticivorans TaxID=2931382 RepID=UPI0020BFFD81|nr:hypothetical protein [Pseudomonas sp. PIA16]MDE1167551.1 hypothetical protein [Pseudomonas sp.]